MNGEHKGEYAYQGLMKIVACSRRSDSGARAKNKASETAGEKNEGKLVKRTRTQVSLDIDRLQTAIIWSCYMLLTQSRAERSY